MEAKPEGRQGRVETRLQSMIASVLVLAFLKWSQPVTMPLAFSLFLVALAWPLMERLERRLPRGAAFAVTVLVLLTVFALFAGALVWSWRMIAESYPRYAGKLEAIRGQAEAWARSHGIPLASSLDSVTQLILSSALAATEWASLILLVAAITVLGLYEVHAFRARVARAFLEPRHGEEVLAVCREICVRYQGYLWAFTVTAVIQGVVVWLFALLVGLDFAFVWGLIAFLLNYVPTVGSALAVLPPTLFALVQFDGLGRPVLVFVGLAALQLICGNYVDPLIQSKYLSISATAVLVSIVFWGWLWGIGGAFLGVPLTMGLVVAAEQFPRSRWLARLLSDPGEGRRA